MTDDEMAAAISADPLMSVFLYKASSQFAVFSESRERYYNAVEQIKGRMQDAPLDFLLELAAEDGNTTKMDPDLISEKMITISDAARREIHRRAFQGFTIAPFHKEKMDAFGVGFLRQPKY